MAAPTDSTARYRILVVDDDRGTRDLVVAMLADTNWHIDCASDGIVALGLAAENEYDAVLTDIHMAGIDGLTLLRRLRESRLGVPVVIMTGDNIPSNVVGSLRGQAFSYLTKPFTSSALLQALTGACESVPEQDDIDVISALPNWISLQIRCKIATADRLVPFLREMESTVSADDREMIATAFRELLLNAIEHGGQLDPEKRVNLTYIRTDRSIIYYVRDPGAGFSLENLPHAAVSNTLDAPLAHVEARSRLGIRPGGFGILLTRNFADELLYSEKGNEVVLIKYLDRKTGPPAVK